ncbi:hypothetical protein CRM22_003941 [Opisthorchis felineus]|uniref:VASt domain-containing protein n=2 Tax=Opisthorchis felineus TaxID=147828 RepID=A0A4S2LYR0_OPIFE|nr:hypothetical protein CRM22_003941 [Opisthorchis felineus]
MCDVLPADALETTHRFTTSMQKKEPNPPLEATRAAPIIFRCGDSDEYEELDPDEPDERGCQESSTNKPCTQPRSEDMRARKFSVPAVVNVDEAVLQSSDQKLCTSFTHLFGSSPSSEATNDHLRPFDAATSAPHSLFSLEMTAAMTAPRDVRSSHPASLSDHLCSSVGSPGTGAYLTVPSSFSRQSSKRLTGWYYSLAPSYKSKLEQFRRVFRGTPVDTERLLVDYSCALSKNNHGLLQQGRMYITENWVCFYSKIISEQKIYLAVKEIIAITKEKTARVIPNAIQIIYSKNHQRFFFTSFSSRERTHAILRKVWENCRNNQSMSIDEIVQQVREIYGDDSLAMLEDEDTDGDPDTRENPFPSRVRTTSDSSDPNLTSADTANNANVDANMWGSDNGANNSGGLSGFATTDEEGFNEDGLHHDRVLDFDVQVLPSSMELGTRRRCHTPDLRHNAADSGATETDPALHETHSAGQLSMKSERKRRSKKRPSRTQPSSGIPPSQLTQFTISPSVSAEGPDSVVTCFPGHDHPGQLYADALIPLNVDALFTCIFTDSIFFDRLSTARGTFNLTQSSWPTVNWSKPEREMSATEPIVNPERTIGYTLKLNQKLGPRTCAAIEQQTLLVGESQPGRCYVIDAKVTNQAVPLCNCFCVVSRYCLLRIDRTNSRLRVSSRVVYEKPVFFGAKSIIENTCRSGLTDFFTALVTHLTEMASALTEEERLTGACLSAQSTNSSVIHDGVRSRNPAKLVAQRGQLNGELGDTNPVDVARKRGRSDAKLPTSPASSPSHKRQFKSSVNPPSNAPVFIAQSASLTEIGYFFLRPDRAWLLLVVVSLLLCLCLSMVYNRLVALEHLAEQLSEAQSPTKFVGPGFMDQLSSSFTRSPTSFDASQSRLRVMKELTISMSQTLAQIQNVLSQVHHTIELLDSSRTGPTSGPSSSHSDTGPSARDSS